MLSVHSHSNSFTHHLLKYLFIWIYYKISHDKYRYDRKQKCDNSLVVYLHPLQKLHNYALSLQCNRNLLEYANIFNIDLSLAEAIEQEQGQQLDSRTSRPQVSRTITALRCKLYASCEM